MVETHHPRRGSMGYSPRKRAKSMVPNIRSWPEWDGEPKLQGFPGFKAGMSHAFMVDYRSESTTSGQEVREPVTVVEVPPVKVSGLRFYEKTHEGLKTMGEVWANQVDESLKKRLPVPNHYKTKKMWEDIDRDMVDEVRAIIHTRPKKVSGIPKKVPDIMESRIGGGTIKERIDVGEQFLGEEVNYEEFCEAGRMVDVSAITKGKGYEGHVKRWGVKLLQHKNSKSVRNVGNTGVFRPGYTRPTVPQAGQDGFHQRTELNKRVLKVGENGEEVTPEGGFVNYGNIENEYIILHGSIPGPSKRLTVMRDPVRAGKHDVHEPNLTYISTESNQGG
ncbi:MAG: 50S ribosomal protein L3 [Candidatus Thermoplasmatota archaeon]|nr:50S ribosomal protein L3 [Candidatus Thermoplasmatota archaeon]